MGCQHRTMSVFFHTKQQYNKQVENDTLKKEWCLTNGIVFLEFWHDQEDIWEDKLKEILGLTTSS
jgi:hypothetical protein